MNAAAVLLNALARETEALRLIFPTRDMRLRAAEAAVKRWPEPFTRAQIMEGLAQNKVIRNGRPEALQALLHLLGGALRHAV